MWASERTHLANSSFPSSSLFLPLSLSLFSPFLPSSFYFRLWAIIFIMCPTTLLVHSPQGFKCGLYLRLASKCFFLLSALFLGFTTYDHGFISKDITQIDGPFPWVTFHLSNFLYIIATVCHTASSHPSRLNLTSWSSLTQQVPRLSYFMSTAPH